MKQLFPQYKQLTPDDYKRIWAEALFVFDANVLLNLYRYRVTTRDELLGVLDKLSPRIWVPYQAALEFERNRLYAIRDQLAKFRKVREHVQKVQGELIGGLENLQLEKRHSVIDPKDLTEGLDKLVKQFLSTLDEQESQHQKLTDPDRLKDRIELLFDGKVGAPPSDQAELDVLFKLADEKFAQGSPPGYRDADKDKDKKPEYFDRGLLYRAKYGDFLVWKQLLAHAQATGIRAVVFVTNDSTDDWWLMLDDSGSKRIGPRTQLVEEAHASNVSDFLMYSSERFVQYAKEYLGATVSEQTVSEIREVSEARADDGVVRNMSLLHRFEVVRRWLERVIGRENLREASDFDFVARAGEKFYGIDVLIRGDSLDEVRSATRRAAPYFAEDRFEELRLVCVARDLDHAFMIQRKLTHYLYDHVVSPKVRFVVGIIEDAAFRPVHGIDAAEFARARTTAETD